MRILLLPDVQELGVSVHVHAGILTMALLEGHGWEFATG
jgi:hypothetical protein